MSCVYALIGVFLIIFVLLLVGGCCYNSREIDTFADNIYKEWTEGLNNMKTTYGIGEPNGFLGINKDSKECNSDQNLLIQSNVAFRPHRVGSGGCTYIQKNYPVA